MHHPRTPHTTHYTIHHTPCTTHYTIHTTHYTLHTTHYTLHYTPYTTHHTPHTTHHSYTHILIYSYTHTLILIHSYTHTHTLIHTPQLSRPNCETLILVANELRTALDEFMYTVRQDPAFDVVYREIRISQPDLTVCRGAGGMTVAQPIRMILMAIDKKTNNKTNKSSCSG